MDESSPLISRDATGDTSNSTPIPTATLTRHEKAAWIVDETTRGVVIQFPDDVPSDRATRSAYLIFCNTVWLRQVAAFALILLSFFEMPSWCSHARQCVSPDGSDVFLSGLPYLPPVAAITVNAFLLVVLLVFVALDIYFPSVHMHARLRQLQVLLAALVVDAVYTAIFSGYPPFRFAPFLRAFLPLFYWAAFAECTMSIVAVVKPFFDVVFFVVIFTLLFGWVVTLFFHDAPEAEFYFGNLSTGLYSAFTSLTTADWPMQVMGVLDVSRPSALLFIAFIVIGVFLLLNLLLAVVYNAYTEHIEELVVGKLRARRTSLGIAYDVLRGGGDGEGGDDGDDASSDDISITDITLMFAELRKNKRHKNLSDDAIDMVFTALDDDQDNKLSREEFMDVADVLQLKFVVELESISPVEKYLPSFYETPAWKSVSSYVGSDRFNYVVDAFMIFNVIIVVIETTMDLQDKDTPATVLVFSLIECGFSFVYLTEMALKISVMGFGAYWRDLGNRFDFWVTWLLLFATLYVLFPYVENDSDIVRLFILLRCLRLFGILADIPRFRRLVHVFSILIPASVPLFSLLFLSLYVFSAAGTEMFGGLIYLSNPALDATVVKSVDAYVSNDYWTLNFNDMAAGWFTLFSSVIVDYLTEIAAAIAAVSSCGEWTKWFFIASFVANSLIVTNCVVALVVDLFVEEDEAEDEVVIQDLQGRYRSKCVKVMKKSRTAHDVYASMFRDRVDEILQSCES